MKKKNGKFPFETRQRFSIRKFNVGVVSVAIAAFLVMGTGVSADEVEESTGLASSNLAKEQTNPGELRELIISTNESVVESPVFVESKTSTHTSSELPASSEPVVKADDETKPLTEEKKETTEKVEESAKVEEVKEDWSGEKATSNQREVEIPYTLTFVNQNTNEAIRSVEKVATVSTSDRPATVSITLDPAQVPEGYKLASNEVARLTQEIRELQRNQLLFALVPSASRESAFRRTATVARGSAFRNNGTMADQYGVTPRPRAVNINHPNMMYQADRSVVTTSYPSGTTYSFKENLDMSIPRHIRPTVIVTYPDGSKDEQVVDIRVLLYDPAKTFVADRNNLTESEKQAIVNAIKAVPRNQGINPTSVFSVANNGDVTVTNYDGTTSVMDKSKTITFNPDIVSLSDETIAKGASFRKTIDFTIAEGNPTVTVTGLPNGLSYNNKVVTGNPTAEKGDYPVTVTVRDGAGRESQKSFVIHVTDKDPLRDTVNQDNITKADDNYTDASQDKKDAYDKAVEDANKVIQNPSASQTEIDNAKQAVEDAKNALDGKSNIKNGAKEAIDQAATDQKAAIDARNELTKEEKDAAKSQIDSEVTNAKNAVDAAQDKASVESAKSTGIDTISAVNPKADTKNAAKQAIDDAAQVKKSEIDTRTDLTDEEKESSKAIVDQEVADAKKAIDAATTNDAVESAKNSGVSLIDSARVVGEAKETAKRDLFDKADEKLAEIDERKDLTEEEKTQARSQVNSEVTKAIEAIHSAKNDAAVNNARQTGIVAIDAINPSAMAKNKAKQAIDDEVDLKKALIDSRTDLTDEEKTVAKSEVDTKANDAKKAIDAATTNDAVTSAKDTGITSINTVNPTPVAKPAAKQAIDDAAAAKKAEIDGRDDLTKEEKDAAKAKVDAEAIKAKDAVDAAKTDADVTAAKDSGVDAIKAENPSPVAKPAAKQAIDDAAVTKKAEIDGRDDLTKEEKDAAKAKVDAEATKAKDAVDAAKTDADVTTAKDSGVDAIKAENPDAVAKPAAKQAIDDAAAAKKAEIDGRDDLTKEEKDAAKSEVDAEATKAKDAVDAAKTDADVTAAKDSGVDAIKAENPDAVAKPAAKQAIDDAAAAKKAEIDGRDDLTKEEKDAAKAKVDAEATKAKDAVDTAKTDADVTAAKDSGVDAIKAENPDAVAKPAAKQAIDDATAAKKAEIDGRDDLTKEEKDAAKSEIDAEATKAKDAVDAAKTDADVTAAKDSGVDAIKAENPSPVAKPAAKQAIDDAAAAKKAEIDGRDDLTKEEKDAAKSEVDAEATKAKDA
ncbi:DUF1542 domain-containing protein, partial [Streptococcus sp. NLN76]|uniref:DUF1542 domain-containing protein n=1 Tax=Streptococcus sp. NLN76 TaxID=2822800 RepID=UPI0018A8B2CB